MQHSKKDFPTLITIGRFGRWSLAVLKTTFFGIGGMVLLVVAGLFVAGALVAEPLRWYLIGLASAMLLLGGGVLALSYLRSVLNDLVGAQNKKLASIDNQVATVRKQIQELNKGLCTIKDDVFAIGYETLKEQGRLANTDTAIINTTQVPSINRRIHLAASSSYGVTEPELSADIARISESRRLLDTALKRLGIDGEPAVWERATEFTNNLSLSLQIYRIANTSKAVITDRPCRICLSRGAFLISLKITEDAEEIVTKRLCRQCGHLQSDRLDDLARTEGRYREQAASNIDRNTRSTEKQKNLMLEAIRYGAMTEGAVLDFGCGGAFEASRQLNDLHNDRHLHFYSCDIFDPEHRYDNYFQLCREEHNYYGRFSAIASNAVIEHTADPLSAWLTLNRLLRPTASGRGVMVHAFPSLISYDLNGRHIIADTHVCLYSYDSLSIICHKTGFRYVTHYYDKRITHHPIFHFEKTRDC